MGRNDEKGIAQEDRAPGTESVRGATPPRLSSAVGRGGKCPVGFEGSSLGFT